MSNLPIQIGPPIPAAYSLRVQLFAAHAHGSGDKPIRCFRVVASPEATVRDFCAEAARIHEINYGEQLTVKKVQDDIGFDVTQSEALGNIFPNTSMVRFVQAAAVAGVRDSVPPDSALRFDPNGATYQNRKRERESSILHDGGSPGVSRTSNKRQRVLSINPDRPVPSREESVQNGVAGYRETMIAEDHHVEDARENPLPGMDSGDIISKMGKTRIPETPPPGSSHHKAQSQSGLSAASRRSINQAVPSNAYPPPHRSKEASSSKPSNRAQAKNVSSSTQKSIEVGSSASKMAVPASSNGGKAPILPSVISANNRKSSTPILPPSRVNGKAPKRSPDEDAIYEDFGPDIATKTVRMDRNGTLKIRNSPKTELYSLQQVGLNGRSIPSDVLGEKSGPLDQLPSAASQLPLTPGNKERYSGERSEQSGKSNQASSAKKSSEHRSRATKIAQQEEQTSRRTEDENREQQRGRQRRADDLGKSEPNAAEMKVAHLKKQQNPKLDVERETAKTVDKGNTTKDKTGGAEQQHEKAVSENINRQQERSDDRRLSKGTTTRMIYQSTSKIHPESSQSKSTSPAIPRATLASISQSSTPFIPSGRKPALKRVGSSHSAISSSPVISRTSPEKSNRNVGIEAAMPLPKGRQVSFTDKIEIVQQTLKPNDQVLTPKPQLNGHHPVLPGRRETPIPLPPKLQSGITRKQSAITSKSLNSLVFPPSSTQPTITTSKLTNSISQESRKMSLANESSKLAASEGAMEPKKFNEPAKAVNSHSPSTRAVVVEISSDDSESDSYSVEDDEAESENDHQSSHSKSADNAPTLPIASHTVDQDRTLAEIPAGEDSDARSTQEPSPQRDSRSPVIFRQPTSSATKGPTTKTTSESYSDDGTDDRDISTSESDATRPSVTGIQNPKSSQAFLRPEQTKSLSKENTKQASPAPPSSRILPPSQQSALRQSTTKSELSTINNNSDAADDAHIQDEIDQQLTSSVPQSTSHATISKPIPIPKSISRISTSTSTPPRQTPELKVGASLSKLNALKPAFGAKPKADSQTTNARSSHIFGKAAKAMGFKLGFDGSASAEDDDEEEEEEEEESESDSSGDERPVSAVDKSTSLPAASSQALASRPSSRTKGPDTSTSGSDSDSDSNFDSDSSSTRSEDEQVRVQRELKAEIARIANV